ncbi:hypothetical protein CTAYLR_000815 [Chrysophaeum taylorii]|uniref:Crossover junction endonuclease MUS81 n=1 Tax=Chrysophaeum taylorii TaxID=2483200 RepID=A0AAD7UQE0_9STRA|nr:hypothetical protein CTAYLR_000815 [Chrysophaeum taylorii]
MARTRIPPQAGRTRGSRGGGRGGGRGGRSTGGRGRHVGGSSRGPPACQENVHICQRLRAYAAYRDAAVAENQNSAIYWCASRELWSHATPVRNATEAEAVHKIGKMIAGQIERYLVWHAAAAGGTLQAKGRWEVYAEKQKWWRLECVDMGARVHVRRSWGMLGHEGFQETIHTLASANAAETLMTKAVREKEREGYARTDDIGDTGGGEAGVREPPEVAASTTTKGAPKRRGAPTNDKAAEVAAGRIALREQLAEFYCMDVEEARLEERARLEQAAVERGEGVQGREYKPKLLNPAGNVSGVAAMLICLLRAERTHGFKGYTKQEVVDAAQPLCPETAMLPTNQRASSFVDGKAHYGAVASLTTTLLKNGVVEYGATKKHFRLSHVPGTGLVSGAAVAQRLEREYKSHFGDDSSRDDKLRVEPPPPPLSIPPQPRRQQQPRQPEVIVLDDSDDDDDDCKMGVAASNKPAKPVGDWLGDWARAKRPRLAETSRFDDEYDITLAVDSREKRQTCSNEADAMLGKLRDQHNLLRVTKKTLEVADYVWIATPRGQSLADWKRDCFVLGRAVERKIVSDFNSTVRGGTHHAKQRLRMLRSPLARLIYLVEGSIEDLPSVQDRQRLLDEMSLLELRDGFTVHCTDHFNTTAAYLKALDDLVRAKVRGKTTAEVLAMPDVVPYDSILKSIDVDPSKWNLKKRWAVMLLHVPGLKQAHVESIIAAGYDAPVKLADALINHPPSEEPLLTRVLEPGKRRAKLAADVAHFFVDRDYPNDDVADDNMYASFDRGV